MSLQTIKNEDGETPIFGPVTAEDLQLPKVTSGGKRQLGVQGPPWVPLSSGSYDFSLLARMGASALNCPRESYFPVLFS